MSLLMERIRPLRGAGLYGLNWKKRALQRDEIEAIEVTCSDGLKGPMYVFSARSPLGDEVTLYDTAHSPSMIDNASRLLNVPVDDLTDKK